MNKSEFGGVTTFTEHAFPTEDMAKINPIKSAHQLSSFPDFIRCCMGQGVEFLVGRFHVRTGPSSFLAWSRDDGALIDDLIKHPIFGQGKPLAVDYLLHAL